MQHDNIDENSVTNPVNDEDISEDAKEATEENSYKDNVSYKLALEVKKKQDEEKQKRLVLKWKEFREWEKAKARRKINK